MQSANSRSKRRGSSRKTTQVIRPTKCGMVIRGFDNRLKDFVARLAPAEMKIEKQWTNIMEDLQNIAEKALEAHKKAPFERGWNEEQRRKVEMNSRPT